VRETTETTKQPAPPRPQSKRKQPRRGPGIVGPYSRAIDRGALGCISGNSREGRFLRAYEAMLLEHVGQHVSIVQRALVSRAARLALHLELMDERSLAGGHQFTEHDHNYYISWSNSLARLLARLGMNAAPVKQPTIVDHIARMAKDAAAD
jgi:hypothetical protein